MVSKNFQDKHKVFHIAPQNNQFCNETLCNRNFLKYFIQESVA